MHIYADQWVPIGRLHLLGSLAALRKRSPSDQSCSTRPSRAISRAYKPSLRFKIGLSRLVEANQGTSRQVGGMSTFQGYAVG